MDFIAIDFETANFRRESICEVGIAVVENSQIVYNSSEYIKPIPEYFEKINMRIHGINPNMVSSALTFQDYWVKVKNNFVGKNIVAHNASFDISALRAVMDAYNLPYPELEYFCSMQLSKRLISGLINYQLQTVCKYFNININHHSAKDDAYGAAQIILSLANDNLVDTLKDLSKKAECQCGILYQTDYRPFSIARSVKQVSMFKSNAGFDRESVDKHIDVDHPFYDKKVVFTGELSTMGRNEARGLVERIGGISCDTVTKSTNFLVIGSFEYTSYGAGHISAKIKKTTDLINSGQDLQILSEDDFFRMIHLETATFEISIEQIEENSERLINEGKFNEFANKYVYFSPKLGIENRRAFQMVGNCSGIGHDYLKDEIQNSDYFVISDEIISEFKNRIKDKSIIDFEQIRNDAQNRGSVNSIQLISESAFYLYLKKREEKIKN